jgi:hypothetical protein
MPGTSGGAWSRSAASDARLGRARGVFDTDEDLLMNGSRKRNTIKTMLVGYPASVGKRRSITVVKFSRLTTGTTGGRKPGIGIERLAGKLHPEKLKPIGGSPSVAAAGQIRMRRQADHRRKPAW